MEKFDKINEYKKRVKFEVNNYQVFRKRIHIKKLKLIPEKVKPVKFNLNPLKPEQSKSQIFYDSKRITKFQSNSRIQSHSI